jgi:hypothetical protein
MNSNAQYQSPNAKLTLLDNFEEIYANRFSIEARTVEIPDISFFCLTG